MCMNTNITLAQELVINKILVDLDKRMIKLKKKEIDINNSLKSI